MGLLYDIFTPQTFKNRDRLQMESENRRRARMEENLEREWKEHRDTYGPIGTVHVD